MTVALKKCVVVVMGSAVTDTHIRLVARAVPTVAGSVRVVNQLVIRAALQKKGMQS